MIASINILFEASELSSMCDRVGLVGSLEALALNCCISETLAEVVLGAVSSAMASIADNRNDNLSILLVVCKNAFESIAEVVKFRLHRHLRLEDARLNCSRRLRTNLEAGPVLEETVLCGFC